MTEHRYRRHALSCPGRAATPLSVAARSRDPEATSPHSMGPGSAAHRRRGAALRPGHGRRV